jgi:hypothetical protein
MHKVDKLLRDYYFYADLNQETYHRRTQMGNDAIEQAKLLLNNFEVTINNIYLEKKIKGFNEINAYFKKEQIKWSEIKTETPTKNIVLKKLKSLLNNCAQLNSIENDINVFSQKFSRFSAEIVQAIREPVIIWTEGFNGKFIWDLAMIGATEEELGGALVYINNQNFRGDNKRDYFIGFIKAYEHFHHDDSTIVKRSNSENTSLQSLKDIWDIKTSELNTLYNGAVTQFEDVKKKIITDAQNLIAEKKTALNGSLSATTSAFEEKKKELQKIIDGAVNKIKENETLYESKLRLVAAVKYWRDRADEYRKRGYKWLMLLGATSLFLILFLSCILYNFPSIFSDKFDITSIKGTFILLTAISIGAYLIRVFSKLTFSSFHLARDAEEREQLTHVYLALKEKHAVNEKQESIVLQSLFSRVDTGLLGGDHSPTMPATAFVEKAVQGKL